MPLRPTPRQRCHGRGGSRSRSVLVSVTCHLRAPAVMRLRRGGTMHALSTGTAYGFFQAFFSHAPWFFSPCFGVDCRGGMRHQPQRRLGGSRRRRGPKRKLCDDLYWRDWRRQQRCRRTARDRHSWRNFVHEHVRRRLHVGGQNDRVCLANQPGQSSEHVVSDRSHGRGTCRRVFGPGCVPRWRTLRKRLELRGFVGLRAHGIRSCGLSSVLLRRHRSVRRRDVLHARRVGGRHDQRQPDSHSRLRSRDSMHVARRHDMSRRSHVHARASRWNHELCRTWRGQGWRRLSL